MNLRATAIHNSTQWRHIYLKMHNYAHIMKNRAEGWKNRQWKLFLYEDKPVLSSEW